MTRSGILTLLSHTSDFHTYNLHEKHRCLMIFYTTQLTKTHLQRKTHLHELDATRSAASDRDAAACTAAIAPQIALPVQHLRHEPMVGQPMCDSSAFPHLGSPSTLDDIRDAIDSPAVGSNRAERIAAAFTVTPITRDVFRCNYMMLSHEKLLQLHDVIPRKVSNY